MSHSAKSSELHRVNGPRRAQVLAVANQKGGVGKTATALHLAAGLARMGQAVTLIDLDPQGHIELCLQGALLGKQAQLSRALLSGDTALEALVEKTRLPNLQVVLADPELAALEPFLAGRIAKEFLLRRALEGLRQTQTLLVLDCPPSLGVLTANALAAADLVIVPCELNLLGLDGLADMVEAIEQTRDFLNRDLTLAGVLRTRVDARQMAVNAAMEKVLLRRYPQRVLPMAVPFCAEMSKAQMAGWPLFTTAPSSPAARAYEQLCLALLQSLGLESTAQVACA